MTGRQAANRADDMTDALHHAMTLGDLIADLPLRLARRGGGDDDAATARLITDLTEDSRTATPGCLFIARGGTKTDGRKFIADAIARGAVAVLSDDPNVEVPSRVALILTNGNPSDAVKTGGPQALASAGAENAEGGNSYPALIARLAERFFGNPSARVTLIGLTGTNGKTTTTHLIHQLLNGDRLAASGRRGGNGAVQRKCGLIGTVLTDDGRETKPSTLTTPSAIDVSRALARMVAHGCTHAVMEVSSHALDQGRVAALRFDVGVFTNLTGDHLDYHGSMPAYAASKARLFEMLPGERDGGLAVVNADDESAPRMVRDCKARVARCRLSEDGQAEARAKVIALHPTGTEVEFVGLWGAFEILLPLVGRHNVCNALQAACVAWRCGLTREDLVEILARVQAPPGRLEPVTRAGEPFGVFVDYAHTDDALENVLSALRPTVPAGGRLTVVFGCGGDRDKTKRPRMATVACRLADRVVITSDNPRTESPGAIIADILTGVPYETRRSVLTQADRRLAIEECIAAAKPRDVIVIAGKGHEDYQIVGTVKRPFDDRIVAREAVDRRLDSERASRPDGALVRAAASPHAPALDVRERRRPA